MGGGSEKVEGPNGDGCRGHWPVFKALDMALTACDIGDISLSTSPLGCLRPIDFCFNWAIFISFQTVTITQQFQQVLPISVYYC